MKERDVWYKEEHDEVLENIKKRVKCWQEIRKRKMTLEIYLLLAHIKCENSRENKEDGENIHTMHINENPAEYNISTNTKMCSITSKMPLCNYKPEYMLLKLEIQKSVHKHLLH
jgi:hypothetical protein